MWSDNGGKLLAGRLPSLRSGGVSGISSSLRGANRRAVIFQFFDILLLSCRQCNGCTSDRHGRRNMSLRCIMLDREIFKPVIENRLCTPEDPQLRRAGGNAGELRFDEVSVIEVEVHIAPRPHQFMRVKITLLGDHPRQQRRLENVEGKAEAKIARALEEQARETAVAANVELIGHVTG